MTHSDIIIRDMRSLEAKATLQQVEQIAQTWIGLDYIERRLNSLLPNHCAAAITALHGNEDCLVWRDGKFYLNPDFAKRVLQCKSSLIYRYTFGDIPRIGPKTYRALRTILLEQTKSLITN